MRIFTLDTQRHQNICSNEIPQVKANDIISLKIYETSTGELDYHMISQVMEVTDKSISLKDIKLIKEPTSNFDNGDEWEIDYNTMKRVDLETYKFVLLGTTKTHPEYTL